MRRSSERGTPAHLIVVPGNPVIGILLIVFGTVVLAGWISGNDFLIRFLPDSLAVRINSALLFIAAGVCLWLPARSAKGGLLRNSCLFLLLVLPAVILLEHFLDTDLGVDLAEFQGRVMDGNRKPGRVSLDAAIAFLLSGLVFYFNARDAHERTTQFLSDLMVLAIQAIGMTALLGYFLDLRMLPAVVGSGDSAVATATGLCVLSAGLWLMQRRVKSSEHTLEAHQKQTTQRTIGALVLVGLGFAGLAFSLVQSAFERQSTEGVGLAASSNASAIAHILDSSLWYPQTIASRPAVVETFVRLTTNMHDEEARIQLRAASESFMTAGLSGVEFYNARGELLARNGIITRAQSVTAHQLNRSGHEHYLLWLDGYLLYTEHKVMAGSRTLGKIVSEQRLPELDRAVAAIRSMSKSTDVLICGREKDTAVCPPSRFDSLVMRLPMFGESGNKRGQSIASIERALRGETGIMVAKDRRGVPVANAYAPIANFGLGMVVQTNVDTLYTPLRERFNLLAGLLVLAVVAGTAILWHQVGPLVARIEREQKRLKILQDYSSDAFVTIGADGLIADWNTRAERTFGWTRAEAIGKPLAEMIIPAGQREVFKSRMRQLRHPATGEAQQGKVNAGGIEVLAMHQSGRRVPIEVSMPDYWNGSKEITSLVIHDISERRAAHERLVSTERRLRTISDNLPVLISYIDRDRIFRFGNDNFEQWFGIPVDQVIDKSLDDIEGLDLYRNRLADLDRALEGKRTEFETEIVVGDTPRILRTTYVPDRGEDGTIVGVYALSDDVSSIRNIENQLTQAIRHDELTGLPNAKRLAEKLPEAAARSRRTGLFMAVLCVGIDNLALINDTAGYPAGDEVLKVVAARLRAGIRATDTVARVRDDEFMLLLEGQHNEEEARLVAGKVAALFAGPVEIAGSRAMIAVSIGIGLFQDPGEAPDSLPDLAREAMERARNEGGDRVQYG